MRIAVRQDVVKAVRIVSAMTDVQHRVRMLLEISKIASQHDSAESARLLAEAEAIAFTITPQEDQDKALQAIISSMLE